MGLNAVGKITKQTNQNSQCIVSTPKGTDPVFESCVKPCLQNQTESTYSCEKMCVDLHYMKQSLFRTIRRHDRPHWLMRAIEAYGDFITSFIDYKI